MAGASEIALYAQLVEAVDGVLASVGMSSATREGAGDALLRGESAFGGSLGRLLGLWRRYGPVMDLFGPGVDLGDQVEEGLASIAAAAPALVGAQAAWVDVGSGGGLPGLVLAAGLSRAGVLVEPRAKRAAFLALAVGELGLAGEVSVVRGRLEGGRIVGPAAATAGLGSAPGARGFECVTARAVWGLGELWRELGGLVRPGGVVLAHCGARSDPAGRVAGRAGSAQWGVVGGSGTARARGIGGFGGADPAAERSTRSRGDEPGVVRWWVQWGRWRVEAWGRWSGSDDAGPGGC